MNEQLVVKNFGPIKDATVDFKRVTVFIGPTGGGKSTLAKLAAVFRDATLYSSGQQGLKSYLSNYAIKSFESEFTALYWHSRLMSARLLDGKLATRAIETVAQEMVAMRQQLEAAAIELKALSELLDVSPPSIGKEEATGKITELFRLKKEATEFYKRTIAPNRPHYIPAERLLLSALGTSWPDLIREGANLPIVLLDFAKQYLRARDEIKRLELSLFSIIYKNEDNRDLIVLNDGKSVILSETASGIQSVTPMLVLLEHLSRNTEQAQSFIIEEPELNLYPTAQQGLLNWLVEKCTKGENDLTITTHSPYILSHLNLMLYAYQVAEKHPDQKAAIAAIVPEASWINPKEFACYQVEGGGVHSLVDAELGLIDNNALDNISGDKADAFDQLININRGFAHA